MAKNNRNNKKPGSQKKGASQSGTGDESDRDQHHNINKQDLGSNTRR